MNNQIQEFLPFIFVAMCLTVIFVLVYAVWKLEAERKKLQKTSEKFFKIFHLFPVSTAITRVSDGMLMNVNDGFCRDMGYASEESEGKTTLGISIWNVPDDRTRFVAALKKTGHVTNFETTLMRKDKSLFPAIISAQIIELDGAPYIITSSYDISVRKRMEEKLKELDKLKDDFLSIATHELKSPLVPILSQTELLLAQDYGEINPKQKEAIEMIRRNGVVLNELTGEVFDIAKIKSNKLRLILGPANLGKIVTDAVYERKILAEKKGIFVSFLLEPGIPNIEVDESRIRQVIVNLLDNAIKFTPENGTVHAELKKTENEILLTVKDSGIGLRKEDTGKIFTPFFQIESAVNRKYRGTGLGLAINKGIMEAHGGKIWVESEGEGKGCTFIASLPIK